MSPYRSEAVDLRSQVVKEALAVSELRYAIPATSQAFRELLGPAGKGSKWDLDRPFRCWKDSAGKYRTEGTSTCGLVASGILGRVLQMPWAGASYWDFPGEYNDLDIVSCFSKLGDKLKVRRPKGARPLPGDICCIGSGLATHVLCAVHDDGRIVTSIDGGQVDDSSHRYLQRIKVCRRQWDAVRVVWVIDTEVLADRLGTVEWGTPCWEQTTAGVQWGLMQLGFNPGPLDGAMGPKTMAAFQSFLSDSGSAMQGLNVSTRMLLASAIS